MTIKEDASIFMDGDGFAVQGMFTHAGSAPVALNCHIYKGVQRLGFESELQIPHTELRFATAQMPSASRGDTWSDGITVYTLVHLIEDDGVIATWHVHYP